MKLLHRVLAFCLSLLAVLPAHAHVGNKDVYQTVTAGPYKLFVTVRTPTVIPGVATIEVRSVGAPFSAISITPLPLAGEASKHPPTSDAMVQSTADPAFYTGSLWIMASGSWQVRFAISGPGGDQVTAVPVPAISTQILGMSRPLGLLLAALGLLLAVGFVGIIFAATREARLAPDALPTPSRTRAAWVTAGIASGFCLFGLAAGGYWWHVEAAEYRKEMHHNSEMRPTLVGDHLSILLGDPDPEAKKSAFNPDGETWVKVKNKQLLPDHGHLMHLYAIRWPEMDAVYHLHPAPTGKAGLAEDLPAMPPGTYHLYADVVFAPSGFPETETATLTVPTSLSATPLSPEDAEAHPAPLSAGDLGPSYKLPDGYTMVWDKPAMLKANSGTPFTFHLLDPTGRPANDVVPYLGMAGHAAFVKTDGTAFAHTHPDGMAAMPAEALAAQSSMQSMPGMANMTMEQMSGMNMPTADVPIPPTVTFPYGFPSAGRYRIFIQMKHGKTVETGVFDAEVR